MCLFDASLLLEMDPDKVDRDRRRMKLALSRHGRIDPFEWENRDVVEMRNYFEDLVDMMKGEGPSVET